MDDLGLITHTSTGRERVTFSAPGHWRVLDKFAIIARSSVPYTFAILFFNDESSGPTLGYLPYGLVCPPLQTHGSLSNTRHAILTFTPLCHLQLVSMHTFRIYRIFTRLVMYYHYRIDLDLGVRHGWRRSRVCQSPQHDLSRNR